MAAEMGKRQLLHYLTMSNLDTYRYGTRRQIFVTPTPYPTDEVIRSLELPGVALARKHLLILEPLRLDDIAGPRHVDWGSGFEYILLNGFPIEAISSRWPLELW
ncbi:hypothetical protein OG241_09045 [Streptomyces sp. NBC_01390]|uniref:hypothetical protein n=1 Tax=Streptomyces sp. NBC_01390 TaxID=2903850 RepID=UPI00324A8190